MTGIELAARVRALRPGIQVVMMTADPASAEAARDRPDLVGRVLVKPITADELLAADGTGDGGGRIELIGWTPSHGLGVAGPNP